MPDNEVIIKHLEELEAIIMELKKIENYTPAEFKKERIKRWQAEHGLQLAIQNLLDIGSHILSSLNKNNCDDYTEIIDRLGENNIIPEDFAKKIRGMAGLRNLLVHDYMEIKAEQLNELLKTRLEDFRVFIKYINKFIEK